VQLSPRAIKRLSSKAITTFRWRSQGRTLQKKRYPYTCHWKGEASYYDVVVDGQVNKDAAWYYPDPSDAAKEIKDRVAFWKGVQVTN